MEALTSDIVGSILADEMGTGKTLSMLCWPLQSGKAVTDFTNHSYGTSQTTSITQEILQMVEGERGSIPFLSMPESRDRKRLLGNLRTEILLCLR